MNGFDEIFGGVGRGGGNPDHDPNPGIFKGHTRGGQKVLSLTNLNKR